MPDLPNMDDIDGPKAKQRPILAWLDDLNETIEQEQANKKTKKRVSTRKSEQCKKLNDAIYQNGIKKFIESGIKNHRFTREGKPVPDDHIKAIQAQAIRVTVKPEHHENSASNVEQCIIAYIGMIPRSFAVKIGGKGTPRKDKNGKMIMTNSGDTNGVSDVIAWVDGRTICIEVKFSPRDTQSKSQIKFEKNINRSGGTYIIVKNFTDFLPKFKSWYDGNSTKQMKLNL